MKLINERYFKIGTIKKPIQLKNLEKVTKIEAFQNCSFVIQSGELYSLGKDRKGKLGKGPNEGRIDRISKLVLDYKMGLKVKIVGVSCGHKHSMSWTNLGGVYSWGEGSYGKIG